MSAAMVAACVGVCPAVRADTSVQAAFATAQQFAPLADAALGTQRGEYVIVAVPVAALRPAVGTDATHGVSAQGAASAGTRIAAPSAVGASSGQVVYFGFDLSSALTTHGPDGSTTYYASEAVGINLSGPKPVVTIASATGQSGSGSAAASSGNSVQPVNGSSINGVAQTVQVAGNDNSVSNSTTISISDVHPVLVVAGAGTACGAACTVSTTPGQFGVGISAPGARVAQGLASGSLYQAVQLSSNGNVVSNTMNLSLQVAPGTAQAVTIPVNLIPTTFGLVH